MKKLNIKASSLEKTQSTAAKLAQNLQGSEVIELAGDVGSGKTSFVIGLVKGLDSKDQVSSPTFALENIYDGRLRVRHLDLYRLNEAGLLGYDLNDNLGADVVVIEWGGLVEKTLPDNRLTIKFNTISELERSIDLSVPENMKYLLKGIE